MKPSEWSSKSAMKRHLIQNPKPTYKHISKVFAVMLVEDALKEVEAMTGKIVAVVDKARVLVESRGHTYKKGG